MLLLPDPKSVDPATLHELRIDLTVAAGVAPVSEAVFRPAPVSPMAARSAPRGGQGCPAQAPLMARQSAVERLKQRMQCGQEALAAGQFERAATEWSAALRSAQRLSVAEALRTTLRNNLAALYHSLGRNPQARRMYKQALSAAEQQHGPQSQPVATILNNLAELDRSGGSPDRAEPLFRKALAILEQAPGGSSQQIAGVLANTAECLREQGKLAEATALNARALSLLETSGTPPGPKGVLLNNMAQIEEQRCKHWEAVQLHHRALEALEQAGSSFDGQRRTALANYARTLRNYAISIDQQLGAKSK